MNETTFMSKLLPSQLLTKNKTRVLPQDIFLMITINNDPFWQKFAFLSWQFLTKPTQPRYFLDADNESFHLFYFKGRIRRSTPGEGFSHVLPILSKLGKEITSKRFTIVKKWSMTCNKLWCPVSFPQLSELIPPQVSAQAPHQWREAVVEVLYFIRFTP